jgi:membrane protease YdiL (CAAX protease family)
MGLATEGGLAVLAVLLGLLLGYAPWQNNDWSAAALLRGVLLTLPMLLLFSLCVRWPVGPLARIKQFVEEFVKPAFAHCTLLDLAVLSLLAGIGEEWLFRGVLQPALADAFGLWPALLLASLLFGLAHPITFTYVVYATLIGLYLGWFAHTFGNLLEVTLAHALYDWIALLYLVRPSQPGPR